jgi:hypothetical protein
MTMARVTWSAVKGMMLEEGSPIEPECMDAIRSVIPDGSAEEADVGFPLAAEVLDIYRYRYESIEAFRVNKRGFDGFFAALEAAAGRVGILAIRPPGWSFIILVNENVDAALACLWARASLPKQSA